MKTGPRALNHQKSDSPTRSHCPPPQPGSKANQTFAHAPQHRRHHQIGIPASALLIIHTRRGTRATALCEPPVGFTGDRRCMCFPILHRLQSSTVDHGPTSLHRADCKVNTRKDSR